jgi:3-oxoacyl-[acyl-carrier-protein] synthase-3
LAKSLVETRAARNLLLITTDTYSKLIHPKDRGVRALFGDGAAATLVGGAEDGQGCLGGFVVGTDGSAAANLIVPSGGFRLPRSAKTAIELQDEQGCIRSQDHLYMDGQAIMSFALNRVPRAVTALLQRSGLTADQVDWYVYHQANKFMLGNLAMCSRIPAEKMVYHLETVGNTVAASIPLALEAYVQRGQIQPGHRLVLVGFGVGLSWAVCLATWG